MDSNLELYKSLLGLDPLERHERMLHLPRSERFRVASIVEREKLNQRLQEKLAGRDLVEMALSDPCEFRDSVLLQNALLGRTSYTVDETKMVKRIMGEHTYDGEGLFDAIANFDQATYLAIPIDAWKLVYCDLYYVDGVNNSLQDIYEGRLREEELQTPAARARENIRRDVIKLARRNAKWMLSELDRLSDEERAQPIAEIRDTVRAIWKRASHAPPAWIQEILRAQQPWGFVYYKTREVEQRYGRKWSAVWDMVNNSQQPSLVRNVRDATCFDIHCQGKRGDLMALQTEEWATVTSEGDLAEDDGFRRHFQEYRQSLSSPGILQNTFIVIPIELIPESQDEELHPYWVWAYDADWDNSTEETVCNSEKYQGRVKVAIYSLNAWFYAARWEGVSLRDMWLKAQTHQDKLWICHSKEMEEWDHEPYV